MPTNFDDIFNAAKPTDQPPAKPTEQPKAKKKTTPSRPTTPPTKPDPWAALEPEQKEATIRLNVDIPIELNDKLAAKAQQLRKSKSELVRELLKWALE